MKYNSPFSPPPPSPPKKFSCGAWWQGWHTDTSLWPRWSPVTGGLSYWQSSLDGLAVYIQGWRMSIHILQKGQTDLTMLGNHPICLPGVDPNTIILSGHSGFSLWPILMAISGHHGVENMFLSTIQICITQLLNWAWCESNETSKNRLWHRGGSHCFHQVVLILYYRKSRYDSLMGQPF